jgi:Na+/proline symporter
MPSFVGIVWGLIGTSFRLRKVSQYRNHQSPVDFITDRFQSQLLRYTIVFLQVVTSVIYLAAQVIAIKSTFNSIFGLNSNEIYPVIIIMICILVSGYNTFL